MRSMYAGISGDASMTPNIKLPPPLWPVSVTRQSSEPNRRRHDSTIRAIVVLASDCVRRQLGQLRPPASTQISTSRSFGCSARSSRTWAATC